MDTKQVTVGTAAVKVLGPEENTTQVILHNGEKAASHYIFFGGDSSVSTATGAHIDPADTYQWSLSVGEEIWAVAPQDGYTLHVIWDVF